MEGFDESEVRDDSKYEPNYFQFDGIDLEGYFGNNYNLPSNIEEYTAEEGNAQLDDPMCNG
jgi:hypothetical protein